jgi:hypothetical protein
MRKYEHTRDSDGYCWKLCQDNTGLYALKCEEHAWVEPAQKSSEPEPASMEDCPHIARIRELEGLLERALEDSGCPGENCAITWHAEARAVIKKATE